MVYAIVAFSPGRASNAAFAVTRNSRHGKSLMTLWSHLYSSWVHSSAHDMSMYLFVYVLDLFFLKLEHNSLLRIGSFVMCSAEVTFWYYCLLVNSSVLFQLSPAAFIFFHRSRLISCIADCDLFVLTRNSLVWFLLLSCTFLLSASSDIVYVPTVTASSFPHAKHCFFLYSFHASVFRSM